ncbi:MAG: type II toxin-antitoxin system RelE/ParE family toxin [Rhodothermales bacterium]|nr:type II toxin-antitoxin system RelE/ParE family toxin [Rhodothermales bacterium]
MIQNFRHKGLRRFFDTGDGSKLNASHLKRIRLILSALNAATMVDAVAFPGSGLHPLKGDMKGFSAVSVSGNWRIVFRFENGDAYDVDYVDYH